MFGSARTPAAQQRAKRKQADATPAKKLKQTFLDFGQKNFDSKVCSICGMIYTAGLEDPDHLKFCKQLKADVKWALCKETAIEMDFGSRGSVVLASKSDAKTRKLREHVDEVLGFCEPENFSRETTSFVFILNSIAVGYLETDPVSQACTVSDPSQTHEVSFGILKIWVHPKERRKHIASMMIDAARAHHGYPSAVPKTAIAFSPPTSLGRQFAQEYCGTDSFLVYKI